MIFLSYKNKLISFTFRIKAFTLERMDAHKLGANL